MCSGAHMEAAIAGSVRAVVFLILLRNRMHMSSDSYCYLVSFSRILKEVIATF
jgi:hypothetical protein